ncbi:MAG: methyltransferase, partial [Candidatus Methanomethyliaceae archaeon]|nr:methyltransferase [Candidatus Methanomethyliaceae archaeon]
YYSGEQQKEKKRFVLRLDIKGHRLELSSSSGIFSKDRIDLGTIVLLGSMVLPEEGEILDMGCGCGVIGITVAKVRPRSRVTMVDINPTAIKLAKENIEKNSVTNAIAINSDLYSGLEGQKYDLIISNPPLAAGYKVVFPLIEDSKSHLKKGGYLQLVLRKGVNAIPKKMYEVFGNVELLSRKSGYKVFRSIKNE